MIVLPSGADCKEGEAFAKYKLVHHSTNDFCNSLIFKDLIILVFVNLRPQNRQHPLLMATKNCHIYASDRESISIPLFEMLNGRVEN